MINRLKMLLLGAPEQNSGVSLVQNTGLRLSQADRIRQMVRMELFRQTVSNESETFEDADDFELDDDSQWVSPYEEIFEPPSTETPRIPLANPVPTPPPAPSTPDDPPAA